MLEEQTRCVKSHHQFVPWLNGEIAYPRVVASGLRIKGLCPRCSGQSGIYPQWSVSVTSDAIVLTTAV